MIKKREGNITIKALIKNSSKNDIPRKQCCNCFYSLLSFCFFKQFLLSYSFFFGTRSIRNLILLNLEINVSLFMNYVMLLYDEQGSALREKLDTYFCINCKFVNFFARNWSVKICRRNIYTVRFVTYHTRRCSLQRRCSLFFVTIILMLHSVCSQRYKIIISRLQIKFHNFPPGRPHVKCFNST